MSRVWLSLSLVFQGGCAVSAARVEEVIVLADVTVVDGTGAPPMEHQTLVLRGGRIEEIGDVGDLPVPAGAHVVQLAGRTVVPGFIDLHVHLPADPDVQQAILECLIEYGITTVLNPGARPGGGVAVRDRVERGEILGPRLLTAGRIIDGVSSDPSKTRWFAHVDDEEEMRSEVRAQAAREVDWIKLYEHVPPVLARAGIEEARLHGLPVVVHAGATTWTDAARLGARMLVHSGFATPMEELIELDDPDAASNAEWYRAYAAAPDGEAFRTLVQMLVDGAVTVVPTLSITEASGLGFDARLLPTFRTDLAPDSDIDDWWTPGWRERHPQTGELDPGEEALLEEIYFPGVLGIVRAYYERGVTLGVGTDVGNSWMTPGFIYHHELELYQRAGIPTLAILKMATRNGAAALGILDDVGTVESGKRADLVILRESPVEDVRTTREIEAVLLGGRFVKGGSLRIGSISSLAQRPPATTDRRGPWPRRAAVLLRLYDLG